MNDGGVRESNSVIVQFIIPGMFAVVFSSILQAVYQNRFNIAINSINLSYTNMDQDRTPSEQAGWQLMGFPFSLGLIDKIKIVCVNDPHIMNKVEDTIRKYKMLITLQK